MSRFRSVVVVVVLGACGCPPAPQQPAESAPPVSPAPVVTPAPATGTPCFDGPPLVATTVYRDLERMAASFHVWDGESPLPSGRYGSCAVDDAVVTSADGREVARLHCGIDVLVPGLTDHLGLQVGALGGDVLARSPGGADKVVCVAAGDTGRCWLPPPDGYDQPLASYAVAGAPPAERIEGAEASAYFESRAITELRMTMYCH